LGVEDSFKFLKTWLGWEDVQVLDWQALRTLVALAWIAAGFLYELGVSWDWAEVQLLAKLGGWEPHKDRKPGKITLQRGLGRLLEMLATQAMLAEYETTHHPRSAQRGCGRAYSNWRSENHAEQDVEPVRGCRNRGMESKKGRRWEELRDRQEKRPRGPTRRSTLVRKGEPNGYRDHVMLLLTRVRWQSLLGCQTVGSSPRSRLGLVRCERAAQTSRDENVPAAPGTEAKQS
jgi:hypothetical protein